MSIIDKALVKWPRLKQRQKRVVSGRSCWRLDIILRTEDAKGKS